MILVALDGLDMLLAQQDHLRNFWRMWSGAVVDACSPEAIKKNQMLKHGPAMAAKPLFKVFIDFSITKRALDDLLSHLFLWGQMRNLRKLHVSQVRVPAHSSPEEQEWLLAQLTLQFLRMDCLWKFCVDAVLLEGHLEQVLGRALERPPPPPGGPLNNQLPAVRLRLELSCPNTNQLRHLDQRGIKLTNFSPVPLQILLETIAATPKSLDLESCEIADSQLQAILPALSRCSQLRILCFFGNRISMSVLRDLLLHTARLSQLSIELYPAPPESSDAQSAIHPGRCSQLCAEITAILKDFRQPNVFVFCTVSCPQCGRMFLYNQGLINCSCPTAA
ncbi:PRAME family member 12-like [Marmota monax]|uniref:PRAME family member 12-like n=1 Tax=Marmota monax TaxID=9995 RepID=UPI001EAF9475|nr:PRAME family member 12-like [Marmota monax]